MDQLPGRAALRPDAPLVGRRLYDLLRRQMADGTLGAGGKVPSTRALAVAFGVSRTTVTAVYEQLAAEGFIVTAAGRVARVASQLALAAPPKPGRRAPPQTPLSAYGRRVENMALPALSSGKNLSVNNIDRQ